jgi:ABC-2 type transport system permease protein
MSRSLPILRRSLGESWKGLLGWSLGVVATLGLYLPIYPSMAGAELDAIVDQLPEQLVAALGYEDIGSGAGYTEATFFGLIGFALLAIAAISWGAQHIGGAEESGRLELELAHGIGRVQYASESAASLIVRVTVLSLVGYATIVAFDSPAQLGLDFSLLAQASLALAGLSLVCGSLAFFFGALGGKKSWGVGAGAGIAVVGYTFNALATQSSAIEWLRVFSPYSWAFWQPPLREGVDFVGLGMLYGVSVLFFALAAWVLHRRDIIG